MRLHSNTYIYIYFIVYIYVNMNVSHVTVYIYFMSLSGQYDIMIMPCLRSEVSKDSKSTAHVQNLISHMHLGGRGRVQLERREEKFLRNYRVSYRGGFSSC